MAKPNLALIPAAQGSKLFSVLPSSGVGDFDFTRSGSATRINSQGLIETVGNGQSRLNYPMIDGKVVGCPHHILEPARTNLVTYSEDFSNSSWNKLGSSIVSNSAISPDGSLNADKFVEDTSNGTHILYRNNITTGAGINTLSVKVKANGRNWVLLYDSEQGEAVYFDLENGVSGLTIGSPDDYSINALPNGWYDISLTTTATLRVDFQIYLAESDGNNSYTGDGTSGVYVWGAQLEVGSYPTSYIKSNSGSTTTRSAETASGAGDASTFNDSEGVLFADVISNGGTTDGYISISDLTTNNRLAIRIGYNNSNKVSLFMVSNGGSAEFEEFYDVGSLGFRNFNKFALKYKVNDVSLFFNGFEVITISSAAMASGFKSLNFANATGGTQPFYGKTKEIAYYNSALTDSELEQLTSWISFTDMANGQLYTIE